MTKPLQNPRTNQNNKLKSSFRDPSGYVFTEGSILYRQINKIYQKDYELLNSSGLYKKLTDNALLIGHKEASPKDYKIPLDGFLVIKPEMIPFISYPYEWAFSMLKDAALLTLQIQKISLEHNMSLKDASAFNIQFLKGKPILIDSLSFEKYDEGKPWIAYKQFVEHFLAPLALMSMVDVRSGRLLSVFLDGIPVDMASSMLPLKSKFNINLLFHIHAHASSQKKNSDKKLGGKLQERSFSKRSLLGMIDNLEGVIKNLKWSPSGTQWEDYYEEEKNNYKSESLRHKATLVEEYIKITKPKLVWDMGANTGFFSNIAAQKGINVISFDVDFGALEKNYYDVKSSARENILPLFSDFTNPTPSVGWENEERESLRQRGPADTVLALALTHHLAITHNLPFGHISSGFAKVGKHLIVEYVDKLDSQVQILLANRKDIFTHYTQKDFEDSFKEFFIIKKATPIKGTKRILYLMERK